MGNGTDMRPPRGPSRVKKEGRFFVPFRGRGKTSGRHAERKKKEPSLQRYLVSVWGTGKKEGRKKDERLGVWPVHPVDGPRQKKRVREKN